LSHTKSASRCSMRVFFLAVFCGAALSAQPQLASDLNDQGLAAANRGDYARADVLYGEALAKWRELGSPYDAHTASTLVNLGQSLCNEGKWRESTGVFEEALALYRRSLGSKHQRTVYNLSLMGHAYLFAGNLERAQAALAEALATERELFAGDAVVEHTLLGMSLLRRQQANLEEALQLGEECLDTALKTLGEIDAFTGMAYENVAAIHRIAGQPARALPLFRKARFIYERTAGAESQVYALLLSEEGLALLDDGEISLAEKDLSQAVEALAKFGSRSAFHLAVAQSNLGLLRLHQRKFADAERLLTRALSLEEQLPSRPVADMAATMGVLAQLRKAQRRNAESAQLRARAAELQGGR